MPNPKKPNRQLKRGTIYLNPEKFELLAALAKSTRIPRAELEREAIDDLLAKNGKGSSPMYDQLRNSLRAARAIAVRYKVRSPTERLWVKNCDDAIGQIDQSLKALGG